MQYTYPDNYGSLICDAFAFTGGGWAAAPELAWQRYAACAEPTRPVATVRGAADNFFGKIGAGQESRDVRQKAICARCPVREQCLEWALDHEEHGVWGGLTKKERRSLLELREAS